MKEERNKMLLPAILSISMLTIMASSAIAPALSAIKNAFPEASDTSIKMVLTLPSLVMIPFSLLSGWLAARMDKKVLVLIGMCTYVVFGIGGGFAQSFTQLIFIRALFGISIGILMPMANTLIFDLVDENKRSKVMGLAGSSNQLGGIIFLFCSGVLATLSWRYSFAVYALVFVSMFLIIFWLPSIPSQPRTNVVVKSVSPLNFKLFALAFLAMMSSVVFIVVNTDLALFIQEERDEFSSNVAIVESRQELREMIEQKTLNNGLRTTFRKKGIDLSASATIDEVKPKEVWAIHDEYKDYKVYKKNNELRVVSTIGTSRLAGNALSLMGIPAVLAGFILAFLMKKLGNYLMPSAAVVMAIGYFTLSNASCYSTILISVLFIGLAGGLLSPPMMLLIPKIVQPQSRTLGIAVISCSILLGQFVSPFYTSLMSMIFGKDGFRFKFFIIAATLLVFAIAGILFLLYNKMKQNKTVHEK